MDVNWTLFNNNCYQLFKHQLKWMAANNVCKNMNSELVSIHSLQEADFLKKRIVNGTNENIWIGGKGFGRDGKWFWPDGSEFGPFENWADGQPNNPNPDAQPLECAYMQTPSRKWGDAECAADYSYPFICMF